MTYVDRDRRQKAKSEQEETEPKTLLHTDAQLLHMASGTSESNRVTETESSPATFSTDVHENTRLSDLPERVGESLSTLHTEPCVGGSTHLSDLPKQVGESLSSLSSESCMRGSQEISISDPGEYISIESPREVHQNSAREVTTGEIDQIGEVLDATVERSRLRNDSAMYRGKYLNRNYPAMYTGKKLHRNYPAMYRGRYLNRTVRRFIGVGFLTGRRMYKYNTILLTMGRNI